jgi:hypothetical protein
LQICTNTKPDKLSTRNKFNHTTTYHRLTPRTHNALDLSTLTTNFLAQAIQHSTDAVLDASAAFRALIADTSPTAVLQRLGAKDTTTVLRREYHELLYLLMGMLLPYGVHVRFSFVEVEKPGVCGMCVVRGQTAHVSMLRF